MILNNNHNPVEIKNKDAVFIRCQASGQAVENGAAKLKFQGYSGDKVDLRDYGLDYPLVYDIQGISIPNKVPILFDHWDLIGHSTSVRKMDNGGALRGKGLASIPGNNTDKVVVGLKNGFPWEASMGLRLQNAETDVEFMPKGHKFTVNNREFVGPMYVARKTQLVEMTVTASGRDSNTSFELLNSETRMKIQSRVVLQNSNPATPTAPVPDQVPATSPAPVPVPVNNNVPPVPPVPAPAPVPVNNNVPPAPAPAPVPAPAPIPLPVPVANSNNHVLDVVMELVPQYSTYANYIRNCAQQGFSAPEIKAAIEVDLKNKALPPAPGPESTNQNDVERDVMLIRMSRAMGAEDNFLVKRFGDKLVTMADKQGYHMQPKELLVRIANNRGGDFTGFSPTENVVKFIERTNFVNFQNGAPTWSTYDLPDFFAGIGTVIKDQIWELNPSFAMEMCDAESESHMKEVTHRRITEGDVMKKVEADGKLQMWSGGNQVSYKTNIDTYGNVFTWTRKDAINDDWDALKDLIKQMSMAAVIIPDVLFGQNMFGDLGSFWVDGTNSFRSIAAFDATTYGDKLLIMQSFTENRGKFNWNVMLDQGVTVITTRKQQPAVWDIIKQPTVANMQKNKYFETANIAVWGNMDNTSVFNTANGLTANGAKFVNSLAWALWPTSKQFAPFVFRLYNNQRSPISEAITLPGEFLGSGMRIYWDLGLNQRQNATVVRCTPAA